MKKLYAFLLALAALSACQEWDPVLTFEYPEPPAREPMMAPVNMTIAGLKQLYLDNGSKRVEIRDHLVIGGQVISSDRSGTGTSSSESPRIFTASRQTAGVFEEAGTCSRRCPKFPTASRL